MTNMTIKDAILKLCARPEGATNRDIRTATGNRSDSVRRQLAREVSRGAIRRSAAENGTRLRFYASAGAADAHIQAVHAERQQALRRIAAERAAQIKDLADRRAAQAAKAAKVAASRVASNAWAGGKTTTHQGARPPMLPGSDRFRNPDKKKPGPPDLVRYTAGASRLAAPISGDVDISRAIITIAPAVTYDPRYQVDPESRPFGAGFAAVGIGRSVETGVEWGRAG